MKKSFRVLLSVVLVLGMLFGMTIMAAAGSMSDVVEITKAVDADGNDDAVTVGEIAKDVPLLTEEIAAAEINDGVKPEELAVLWQKDVTAAKLPATLTFKANGVKDNQLVYVFHWNGEKWELITSGKGSTVEATFTDLSPVGIVSRVAEEEVPPTGDRSNVMLWGALMLAAAAGLVGVGFYSRKRKAD